MLQATPVVDGSARICAMADTAPEAKRLASCKAELQRLTAELADIGFISAGSLVRRYTRCGNPAAAAKPTPTTPRALLAMDPRRSGKDHHPQGH